MGRVLNICGLVVTMCMDTDSVKCNPDWTEWTFPLTKLIRLSGSRALLPSHEVVTFEESSENVARLHFFLFASPPADLASGRRFLLSHEVVTFEESSEM